MKRLIGASLLGLTVLQGAYGQFKAGAPAAVAQGTKSTFRAKEMFFKATEKGPHKFSLQNCAPANPSDGPTEIFVYENSLGTFKFPAVDSLGVVGAGSAKYTWSDGTKHNDQLTYYGFGSVVDNEGHFVPKGTEVDVWAFMASDEDGNQFFLYFGVDDIVKSPQGPRFPMYYSWTAPGPDSATHRLISKTGTTRK